MRKITQKDKAKIIMQLEKGITSTKIASKLGFTRQQVAAIKAHMTMGTYQKTGQGVSIPCPYMKQPVDVTFRLELDFDTLEELNEIMNSLTAKFDSPLSLVTNQEIVAVDTETPKT